MTNPHRRTRRRKRKKKAEVLIGRPGFVILPPDTPLPPALAEVRARLRLLNQRNQPCP